MNLISLMRQFTIRFRMLGAIAVVLVLLGLLGGAGMFGMFRIYSMSEDFMNSSFQEVGYMAPSTQQGHAKCGHCPGQPVGLFTPLTACRGFNLAVQRMVKQICRM